MFSINLKKTTASSKSHPSLTFFDIDTRKSVVFYSEEEETVRFWAAILMNHINQSGMQDFYRMVKWVGKGKTADVYLA